MSPKLLLWDVHLLSVTRSQLLSCALIYFVTQQTIKKKGSTQERAVGNAFIVDTKGYFITQRRDAKALNNMQVTSATPNTITDAAKTSNLAHQWRWAADRKGGTRPRSPRRWSRRPRASITVSRWAGKSGLLSPPPFIAALRNMELAALTKEIERLKVQITTLITQNQELKWANTNAVMPVPHQTLQNQCNE